MIFIPFYKGRKRPMKDEDSNCDIQSLPRSLQQAGKTCWQAVCLKSCREAILIVWQIMYKIPCSTSPCSTYLTCSLFLLITIHPVLSIYAHWYVNIFTYNPISLEKKIMFFWWYRYHSALIVIYICLISYWEQQRKGIMPFSFSYSLLLPPNPGAWNLPHAVGVW